MNNYFSSDFFINNRAALKNQLKDSLPIVISAHGVIQRSADDVYPFRQNSSFWYLTGLNEPDLVLVIESSREYLIVPRTTDYQDVFDVQMERSEITKISGIKDVFSQKQGWEELKKNLKSSKTCSLPFPSPSRIRVYGFYTNPAAQHLYRKIKAAATLDLVDARQDIARLRMIKQKPELDAIKKAVDITVKAFKQAKESLGQVTNEADLQAVFDQNFLKNRTAHAYEPVVSAGQNTCTLHYRKNDSHIVDGQGILIDVGALWQGYAADISRTYWKGKRNSRAIQVQQAVIDVQDYAFSILKPGITIKEYEQKIEKIMGEHLEKLGLITIQTRQNIRRFYPHATSHFLGLDVHDAADYTRPLEAGMVMTVEPGIYIPEEGIGIRIEDDVVITKNGNVNLSRSLPRNLV